MPTPQHSGLGQPLDYRAPAPLPPGSLVRVPLGRRQVLGVVWETVTDSPDYPPEALKPVDSVLALAPLDAGWRALIRFAAAYYQRGLGEMAASALPGTLAQLDETQLARRLKRLPTEAGVGAVAAAPALQAGQQAAVERLSAQLHGQSPAQPVLLWGLTGSGKTEVYLHAAAQALALGRQVLVLVPEINLTPQLQARFAARFGAERVACLHSGLTPAQRLRDWLRAHSGQAELVLGTRLAVLASLPRLGLIVVDEEHDASFKAQDGARQSARDLAVWRAANLRIPIVLGSATPSLETWHNAQQGRYQRADLIERIGAAPLPKVRLVDLSNQPFPKGPGATPPPLVPQLLQAIEQRIARGEQSLLLLNRRGYAPVLHCGQCSWRSGCPHCSAWRVFHKSDRTLRCHHCGFTERVPTACPDCGNQDIAPIGRGTERLEEQLESLLPGARLARLDADTTKLAGSLEAQLARVHAGEVDVLVGTQMIAKGHDFRRVTLVAALNPDNLLYSSDFRAPERLFALLMQAGGRAGRAGALSEHPAEMWVQTHQPRHPLYQALQRHDFAAFAASQLEERQSAGLPPFAHLALLRADSRDEEGARDFLRAAAEAGRAVDPGEALFWYPPIPHPVPKVANQWRWQMLVECSQRAPLQRALAGWVPALHGLKRTHKSVTRWAIDVDPLAI
ncbi:primosomal protein N' (replication factor Y) [Inhella inkyongensis]|uniref:Replication restart protein PriA n=1 Tax=Inhella inkyongensis TaxID=392593 RepID=A0A840S7Y5_9BURK|nr:primosomal protein N' [Inhella inkyongensis]MBB5205783.1 primosomal protein N' (replication factor Y) [Inhella inkyongensis]